jgi:hypothetical protein
MLYQTIKGLRPGRRAVLQSLLCGAAGWIGGLPRAAFGNEPEFLLDFSYAGYGAGLIDPPVLSVASRLKPSGGDDTDQINRALERVSSTGRDGAVLLGPGRFLVDGQIHLRGAGVVLRGAPNGATTIVARGVGRRALIDVSDGHEDEPITSPVVKHTVSSPMGVGYLRMGLADTAGLTPGADILIRRPSTAEWIAKLGMNTATGNFVADRLHWKPGTRDLVWRRTVTSVDTKLSDIELDAPITYSLGPGYGGGEVSLVMGPGAMRLGVEDLVLESAFDKSRPKDEEHSWIAIAIDGVQDAWVRNVTTRHFVSSAVRVGHRARRVTIDRVRCLAPVSEIGGYRRQSFVIEGQQVLVADCQAEEGLNDFSTGMLAGGPNVFLRCTAKKALGDSGGWESFSPGVLFDNVTIEGAGLTLGKDAGRVQGAGWTSGNSTFWNVVADRVVLETPPGSDKSVFRRQGSLYERQRSQRRKAEPAYSKAEAGVQYDILMRNAEVESLRSKPVKVTHGRFTLGRQTVWGGALNHGWWRGQTYPDAALDHGRSFSRFVPGRTGRGLTEDLDVLADDMVEARTPFFQSGPGLWYDRRRDDHALTERPDGNVWAPFYEMPWARSGTGKAYDGLSKYDLTKYNPWYFQRLREFTAACDTRGLIHFHNLYNTHNVLETAAHWTDYPWRPFNNINDTGLPEPMPLEAGNTVHIANQFYSMDYPPLAQLHRSYINKVLDEVGGAPNIILGVAFQFAGPLGFQQAFLDLVAEWEKKNGKTVRIALTTSKDITDAILEDPVRGRQVEVIDQRYWQYRPDGTLWAPKGGRNLAFREMITQDFGRSGDSPPNTTPEQAYRQVREYTARYPDKAVCAWHNGVTAMPALMAGAAQVLNRNPSAGHGQGRSIDRTPVDAFVQEHLADRLAAMSPANDILPGEQKAWALADADRRTVLIYSYEGPAVTLPPTLSGMAGLWFNPVDGRTISTAASASKPDEKGWALLLRRT